MKLNVLNSLRKGIKMKKSRNINYDVKGKSNKSISPSTISQRKHYGYRPNGSRTSEGAVPPDCGTSIQNKKHK